MQATRKAAVRFQGAQRAARFPARSVGRHHANARSRPAAGQRGRDRQEGDALRSVRHPALQRAAARSAHPLRRRPSRRGGPQPARSPWAKASPAPPPHAASRSWSSDVRNDPRYLNTVDAVRTELAVPMIARGKLVGVIDLQSTRVNAYTEYDRALLRLIAARVGIAIDNARLYRRVDRQNRTLQDAVAISRSEFSSILDLERAAGQDRQHHARPDQLRRLQHSAGGRTRPRRCATASASATTSA